MIPIGVRMPVVSMSTRALMGMVQAFCRPGKRTASSISARRRSLVIPLRHSDCGFRTMTVSIIESGAGSVAVSARPAFPNTVLTSGNFLSARSWVSTRVFASSMEIPGTVIGMKRMEPSSRGGMNSEPRRFQG